MIIHKFELAGLGKAPFHFVGHEQKIHTVPGGESKPGGSCQYCWTAVTDCFWVKSSDGKLFYVGCDCIFKLDDDTGLVDTVKREVNRLKCVARHKKESTKVNECRKMIETPAVREILSGLPHPMCFEDRETGKPLTMLDWAEWMFSNAGNAGKIRLLKRIQKELTAIVGVP